MAKNYISRAIKKTGRALKKRYFKGKGYSRPKIGKMIKDVSMLKTIVNAEKEHYIQQVTSQAVHQGTPYLSAISNIPEGGSHGQRNGESVKLHGFRWNIRVRQQGSRTTNGIMKIWLVKYIGPRGTAPNINTFLNTDFDGYYSTSSMRNEDWFRSYQVVASCKVIVPSDQQSGEEVWKERFLYGRFKGDTHQRYSGTSESTLLTDQMYVIAVVDRGTGASSNGLLLDYKMDISFYDN